ncbi:MAG: tetratricopeptide repeat protein [Muribaculum sp.]|nr:tetratricopeptide repeat protein [Muribaculum sp.]
MCGCSLKKNTASTRNYTAFITRYNVYFNGDEHYKETMKTMERNYDDDYSQLLFLHPADARSNPDAPQPQGDFTRSIEKAQKAIQLRSIKKKPARKPGKASDPAYKEWMKREEYNPFLHNAWMMMGRSQYNNGDFLGAASTFYYISRHFSWLPATVTEAKIWQARSYCSLGWGYEALGILEKIPQNALVDNRIKELYNTAFAAYYVSSAEPEKAVPYIVEAIKYAKGVQKSRLYFLLGQLYQREGEKAKAYEAFSHAGGSGTSYRTQLNARIRQSEVYVGDNITSEVKALQRMTRYDRNKDYLDQIYYAIGNLYLSRRDTTNAIKNYVLAADNSVRNGIDKAISQLTLGGLYFERRQYDLAQPCYAEAVPILPKNYPGYDSICQRSDVLDELAVYTQNVNLNDSLLRLADMPEAERLAVIQKIIDRLKKQEKEDEERAKREEYLANQQAQGQQQNTGNAASAPSTFTINNDDSWYFYNTATRNAGKAEFQKRWGSRKLEDDWRRRNKSSFSFNDFNEDEGSDAESDEETGSPDDSAEQTPEEKEAAERESDPHYPEYYLKQIPSTSQERANANEIIQEGMYNIGLILKDKLEAYSEASDEWNALLARYPDNIYRLDVYYNMYLMYMRLGRTAEAERYRALVLSDFPDSKYGQAMRDPHYLDKLRKMDEDQETLYANAYEAYLNNDNDYVHKAYIDMKDKYPLSKIMPKFMFIDALAYVTENDADKFKKALTELLERYPDTDITPLASAYLKGLAQGRKLHAGSSNLRGMIWDLRLGGDSLDLASDSVAFDLNPDEPQLLVLVYPTDEVSSNQLLFDVARHNFSSFVVKDFELEQMNFGRLGLLLVKGFANFDELVHYRKVLEADTELDLPPQVRPVMISVKNFDTLLHQGRTFEDYFRYVDEQASEAPVTAAPGRVDDGYYEDYGVAIISDMPQEIPEEEPEVDVILLPEGEVLPDDDGVVPDSAGPDSLMPVLIVPDIVEPVVPADTKKPDNKDEKKNTMPAKTPVVIPEYPEGSEGDDDLLDE